jgi:hypothetical protein
MNESKRYRALTSLCRMACRLQQGFSLLHMVWDIRLTAHDASVRLERACEPIGTSRSTSRFLQAQPSPLPKGRVSGRYGMKRGDWGNDMGPE